MTRANHLFIFTLITLITGAASSLGGQSVPVDVSEFARPAAKLVAPVEAGVETVTITPGSFTIPGKSSEAAVTVSIPLLIDQGARQETVSPSWTDCTATTIGECRFTATFAFPHDRAAVVQSGTKGFEEAITYQNERGGGIVTIDDTSGQGPLPSTPGYANVALIDKRNNGNGFYYWNGSQYVMQFQENADGVAMRTAEGVIYADRFTSLQSAISAACAMNPVGKVVIPAGTYTINPPLTLCNYLTISGPNVGTATIQIQNYTGDVIAGALYGVHMRNLTWLKTGIPGGTWLHCMPCQWWNVHNLTLTGGTWQLGINLDTSTSGGSSIYNRFAGLLTTGAFASNGGSLVLSSVGGASTYRTVNANQFINDVLTSYGVGTTNASRSAGKVTLTTASPHSFQPGDPIMATFSYPVTSGSCSGSTITLATGTAHGASIGDWISVQGVGSTLDTHGMLAQVTSVPSPTRVTYQPSLGACDGSTSTNQGSVTDLNQGHLTIPLGILSRESGVVTATCPAANGCSGLHAGDSIWIAGASGTTAFNSTGAVPFTIVTVSSSSFTYQQAGTNDATGNGGQLMDINSGPPVSSVPDPTHVVYAQAGNDFSTAQPGIAGNGAAIVLTGSNTLQNENVFQGGEASGGGNGLIIDQARDTLVSGLTDESNAGCGICVTGNAINTELQATVADSNGLDLADNGINSSDRVHLAGVNPTFSLDQFGNLSANQIAGQGISIGTNGTTIHNSNQLVQFIGQLTTQAAGSDVLTNVNLTTGSHCVVMAANATAGSMTGVYPVTANQQVILYHPAIAGGLFNVFCSVE